MAITKDNQIDLIIKWPIQYSSRVLRDLVGLYVGPSIGPPEVTSLFSRVLRDSIGYFVVPTVGRSNIHFFFRF